MVHISLIAAAGVVAMFGWGWVGKVLNFIPKKAQDAKLEQRIKAEGAIKANGTVSVDKEFDAELTAQLKEMDSIDAAISAELDTMAKQQ